MGREVGGKEMRRVRGFGLRLEKGNRRKDKGKDEWRNVV
jgi:hypothetical protein